MTPGKFNWFLHTMLFLQTQYVLNKNIPVQEEDLEDNDNQSLDGDNI
jgi:hypothetical protein